MSGEGRLSPLASLATEQFDKIKEKIAKYDEGIDFPAEFEDLDIQKLSSEECGELSVQISSYAIYIQRLINKEHAYLQWLESKINLSIAGELNSYVGYYSNEQRRSVAIVNNEYAKQLEELRINTKIKVDLLSQLPYYINQLSQSVIKAQQEKRHGKTNIS